MQIEQLKTSDPWTPGPGPDQAAPPIGELLTAEQLAALLQTSVRSIRRWQDSGRLPAPVHLPGRLLRWWRSEILDWLRVGCPARGKDKG